MRLLLDTHVLLWWEWRDALLNATARAAIANPRNEVWVSAASVWEIEIKRRKGKLAFNGSPLEAISASGFGLLAIDGGDASLAGKLDWTHVDPFDRVLVSQATLRGLTLVHADGVIRSYSQLAQLWAA